MRYLIIILLLLGGCTVKKPSHSQSVALTIKAPSLRYSGAGFLYRDDGVLFEAYEGRAAFRLGIRDRVCLDGRCLSFEEFNRRFLVPCYPADLIKRVLLAKPLVDEGLKKTENGFLQRLRTSCFDIVYSISGDTIYFKDKKNNILIKIRRLDG